MARGVWQNNIQTDEGDIVPGAQIDIVNEATGLPWPAYDARTGGSLLTPPIFADGDGYIKFYVEPARIRVTATGVAGAQTFRDEQIIVPQEDPANTDPGRFLVPGSFGSGEDTQAPILTGDFDGALVSGKFDASGMTTGFPVGTNQFGLLTVGVRFIGSGGLRVDQEYSWNGQLFSRWNLGGVWQSWQELYTEANLNVNVFGPGSTGDRVAFGFAISGTTGLFDLAVSGIASPVSITVVGTFDVQTADGTTLASGVVPVLSSTSNNKNAVLVFTIAGASPEENLQMKAGSNSSKITVNF